MNVLRNFSFAKNEKELKVLHKEHTEFVEKLNSLFSNTTNITSNKKVDAMLRHNFRDTIQSINRLYTNEYCVSYNEIYLGQLMIINPAEVKNVIRQKEIESILSAPPADADIIELTREYLELKRAIDDLTDEWGTLI